MNLVYDDYRIVEEIGHFTCKLLEFLGGDTVVINEANTALGIFLRIPDKLRQNLLADFGLLCGGEAFIIGSLLVKVRYPDFGRCAKITL